MASPSPPVPLPGADVFTPKTAPAPLFRARHGAGLFLSLSFPYGTAEKRVCQLSLLLLLPPRGASATAPRIIAESRDGAELSANYAIKSD